MIAALDNLEPTDGNLEVVEVVGDDSLSRRLGELGVSSGKTLKIIKKGNPALINISGSPFALSQELVKRIYVKLS